jgi:hypothetical protein
MEVKMNLQLGSATKRFLAHWDRTGQLDPHFLLAHMTFNVFKHVILPREMLSTKLEIRDFLNQCNNSLGQ